MSEETQNTENKPSYMAGIATGVSMTAIGILGPQFIVNSGAMGNPTPQEKSQAIFETGVAMGELKTAEKLGVFFVDDTSGDMAAEKIEEAARDTLTKLDASGRVNIEGL